jgi:hypothetical protein
VEIAQPDAEEHEESTDQLDPEVLEQVHGYFPFGTRLSQMERASVYPL